MLSVNSRRLPPERSVRPMPALQPDEVLYPGPFPPEVASRVNDYRAAAFLVGQEIAVGVIRAKAFGVQEHYAL